MDRALKTRYHISNGISWNHDPRCYLQRYYSIQQPKMLPFKHCLAPQPKMSSFLTLLGTITQNVILFDIAQHNNPRCHPFRHCLEPQHKMSSFSKLLGTTAQDVILSDIAWHHNPRCHPFDIARCSDPRCQPFDIARHSNPRCQPFRHCLAPQPKMSSFLTLLGAT